MYYCDRCDEEEGTEAVIIEYPPTKELTIYYCKPCHEIHLRQREVSECT